jgi:hypothetical protein
LTDLRLTFENPLAARGFDVIDTAELCQDGRFIGRSLRWSRPRAHDFFANEPTRAADASSTKRTHGTLTLVENRANEPNLGLNAWHNRQETILSLAPRSIVRVTKSTERTHDIGRCRSTKRTHDARTTDKNRANEPNSAGHDRHNRHGQIGS